jgi:hypothetical protein
MASDSTYQVERQRHVDGPPSVVLEHIVDLRRWTAWSPWEGLDDRMRRTYGGADRGRGAWYEWDGNRKAGRGRMEITEVDDQDASNGGRRHEVTIDLQFLKPFKSHSTTRFIVQPDGDGSLVTWSMTGPHTTMSRVMGVFTSMDKLIGPDFEKGLAQLQDEVEGGADSPAR